MIERNRLIKFLNENVEYISTNRPQCIDLYHYTFFDDVHPTITTRTVRSYNYFLIEYEEDKENMEHCNIEVVGRLTDLKFGVEQNRKFSVRPQVCSALQTCGGGNREPKIVEYFNNDIEMNEYITTKVAFSLNEGKWANMHEQSRRVYDTDGIAPTQHTCGGGNLETKILEHTEETDKVVLGWSRDSKGNVVDRHPVEVANCVTAAKRDNTQNYVVEMPSVLTKARTEEGKKLRREGIDDYAHKEYVPRKDGCSGTLTSVQKDNYVVEPSIVLRPHGFFDGAENTETSPAVTTSSFQENHFVKENISKKENESMENGVQNLNYRVRKLTPRVCFRLMGVSEEDIDLIQDAGISNSQQYKLAGNSIVVDVLEQIFRKLLVDKEPDKLEQLSLEIF